MTDPVATAARLLSRTSFFHARTARRMTDAEVIAIIAAPRTVPDSDDEPDADNALERTRKKLLGGAPGTAPPHHLLLAGLSKADLDMMYNWNLHLGMWRGAACPSDATMPGSVLRFARLHAGAIAPSWERRAAFARMLLAFWEHRLIGRDHLVDCLAALDDGGPAVDSPPPPEGGEMPDWWVPTSSEEVDGEEGEGGRKRKGRARARGASAPPPPAAEKDAAMEGEGDGASAPAGGEAGPSTVAAADAPAAPAPAPTPVLAAAAGTS